MDTFLDLFDHRLPNPDLDTHDGTMDGDRDVLEDERRPLSSSSGRGAAFWSKLYGMLDVDIAMIHSV